MKVINKDNIESFKKKNKIKEWVSYLFKSFVEGVVIIMGILLSIALILAPITMIILFIIPKNVEIGLLGIIIYLCMVFYMWLAIDDKIRRDERKW